jgi:branched-chain amino acid transport system ATP-binding protein
MSLAVEDLEVRYGSALAVSGVSFEVAEGSVLSLLGANGAGKSSVARACAGLVTAAAGRVTLGGMEITRGSPEAIRRAGLVYLPEIRGIFPRLSVSENLRLAVRLTAEPRTALDHAYTLFPVLRDRRNQQAGTLSGGQQQMLSLARVLAGEPKVVIVDEPSLGLAPILVEDVFGSLQQAKQLGVTMVLIEQFAHRALAFSDYCVILRHGRVSWEGPASSAGAVLSEHYLGIAEPTAG